MTNVWVRPGFERDAAAGARLHAEEITDGFLPALGPRFLTRLYGRVVRSPRSFLIVAEEDGHVIGHAAATEDVGQLYRQFLLHDGVTAALVAVPGLVRHWRRVLETLRYPSRHTGLPSAELLAVVVEARCRGRGIGHALVAAANDELARRGVTDARVVVGVDNGAARALYRSSGFRPSAMIRVHAQTPSEVLTWS